MAQTVIQMTIGKKILDDKKMWSAVRSFVDVPSVKSYMAETDVIEDTNARMVPTDREGITIIHEQEGVS